MKKIRQQHLREVRAGKRGCPPGLGAGERGQGMPIAPPSPVQGVSVCSRQTFPWQGLQTGILYVRGAEAGSWGEGWGAFCNHHSHLAAISRPRRPCAAGRAACCLLWLAGCSLPSLPCEQVLPARIHVVSGWVAVGGYPGAELAPRGVAPQGRCSHQCRGLPGLGWGW